ncbi:MAG: hypothetical protein A4E73_00007 [Syntrophaceae bacterium PtaU1.Bin231]|nr:MAG: hypothetical protein A4E73_00007 [Syntrophaceae bacterium PtaU1.Bin231]
MSARADSGPRAVIDSGLSFAQAVAGSPAPADVLASLRLIDVRYLGFDGLARQGQLLIHRRIADEVSEIFRVLMDLRFPVAKARPIVLYGWSDDASMKDNNSTAFHYRCVAGTSRLSHHALGLAVDINPFLNPLVHPDGRTVPEGAAYHSGEPGVIAEGGPVLSEFLRRGWRWGGHFDAYRDHHHFEKPLPE